jgi:hypothetical protein
MELLTDELRAEIPPLYATENITAQDKEVVAKFFFPAGEWTWFVIEGNEEEDDFIFFGYVVGFYPEWGYFTLNELESIEVEGLSVERDLHFQSGSFRDVIDRFWKERS